MIPSNSLGSRLLKDQIPVILSNTLIDNIKPFSVTSSLITNTNSPIKYDVLLSRQSVIGGYTLQVDVSWLNDSSLSISSVKISVDQIVKISGSSSTETFDFRRSVAEFTNQIPLGSDARSYTSISVTIPANAIPSIDTGPIVCQYILKIQFIQSSSQLTVAETIETPIIVVARSKNVKAGYVETGVPLTVRSESLNLADTFAAKAQSGDKVQYIAIYPYYSQTEDELNISIGDSVIICEEYQDGYALVELLKKETNSSIFGFVPVENLLKSDSNVAEFISKLRNSKKNENNFLSLDSTQSSKIPGSLQETEIAQSSSVQIGNSFNDYTKLKNNELPSSDTFEEGCIIVKEGEMNEEVYIISDGDTDVRKDSHQHNVKLMGLKKGDFVGLGSWLEKTPHSATVTAIGPVIAFKITFESFNQLMESLPGVGVMVAKYLTKELRNFRNRLASAYDLANPDEADGCTAFKMVVYDFKAYEKSYFEEAIAKINNEIKADKIKIVLKCFEVKLSIDTAP
ncbi:hypothetical protein HK096_008399, partial [Nowakowskiella sp. JEL0078]